MKRLLSLSILATLLGCTSCGKVNKTPTAPVNEITKTRYRIGDLYPDTKEPVGIVFWLNPDADGYQCEEEASGYDGKAVALTEAENLKWKHENTPDNDITGSNSGNLFTKKLIETRSDDDFDITYPAFYHIYKEMNQEDIDGPWYLPAATDVNQLYTTYNGGNAYPPNKEAQAAFNTLITSAGGIPLSNNYWTTTHFADDKATCVINHKGGLTIYPKNTGHTVRCVRIFNATLP